MHRAANPFVVGEYAQKRIIQQYQFFRSQNKLSAFFIRSGLPLKTGALRILGWCRRKGKMSFGSFAQAQQEMRSS